VLKQQRGFSLIELIVGMAIFGILLALAIPSFSGWLRNTKLRTAAESLQNGLQLARAEAVRRNTAVRFQLVTTTDSSCALDTGGPHWVVSLDDASGKCDVAPSDTDPRIIQLRNRTDGSDSNTVLAAGQPSFVFNGLGRLTSAASTINITHSVVACGTATDSARCLRVAVSAGGQIRMCDPALPTGDAQGC